MVSFLLENGADPNVKDVTGRTAFDIATFLEREKTIQVFKDFFKK